MPKTTNKIWTKEEDQFLLDHYSTFEKSVDEFAKLMNRPRDSVTSRASFLKIKKPKRTRGAVKYSINENYFSKIDTHEKAYWYGFLWADGSIYKWNFELALQARDLYVIEEFKKAINSNHPIKKHKKYETYRFCFANKKIIQLFKQINIGERKSYTSFCPIISNELFFSFLLGLFDGDGNVTDGGGLRITTSPDMGIWLKEKFKDLADVNLNVYPIKDCYAIRADLNIQKDSLKVFNLMYKN